MAAQVRPEIAVFHQLMLVMLTFMNIAKTIGAGQQCLVLVAWQLMFSTCEQNSVPTRPAGRSEGGVQRSTQLECRCWLLAMGQTEPSTHGCPDRQQQYTVFCGKDMVDVRS